MKLKILFVIRVFKFVVSWVIYQLVTINVEKNFKYCLDKKSRVHLTFVNEKRLRGSNEVTKMNTSKGKYNQIEKCYSKINKV